MVAQHRPPQLENFVDEYVAWAERKTSAPEDFHTISALMVCAAALGDRVWLEPGYKSRLFPALWTCFVGPSDTHKSTAINLAMSLLNEAVPQAEMPGEFTKESGFDLIAERGCGIMRWGEIGVPFENFAKDYNKGLLSLLTSVWDSVSYSSRTTKAGGTVVMRHPSICILAGGKERWFNEYLSSKSLVRTGFIGRWMFFEEHSSNGYLPFFGTIERTNRPDNIIRQALVQHLQALATFEGVIDPGVGAPVLEAFGAKLKHDEERDPAEFSGRAEEQVAKLAIAIQAARGTHYLGELREEAVRDAIKIWQRSYRDGLNLVERATGHVKNADSLDRLVSIIKQKPRMSRTELIRRSKLFARQLDEITETLAQADRIIIDHELPTERGGSRRTFYRSVTARPEEDFD